MSVIIGVIPGTMPYALIAFLVAVAVFVIYHYTSSHTRRKARSISSSEPDYSTVFPPSQRSLLFEKTSSVNPLCEVSKSSKPLLKLASDFRLSKDSTYVFSGFTVGEIKALGNFPDYARLSGISLPSPVPSNFNINTVLPRPYRPFRWRWHQNMSFKKLNPDYWLELENTYRERISQRQSLYQHHGEDVLQALPGSELACKELMETAVQFLCARYPHYFYLKGQFLVNRILDTKHNLATAEPLHVLLDNVPEDFAIMLRDEQTGRYMLRAGVVCSSIDWNLGEKIGLGLAAIHGPVPDYKENMQLSIDRFFTKMPTSSPIERGSWTFEVEKPLYIPPADPLLAHRKAQSPKLEPEDIHLRVDWQTFRRLPLSGAMVFNFKALFTPITEFRDEPYIPSLVLKLLNDGKENLLKYKGTWHVEHVLKPALREYERAQIQSGVVSKAWECQTLDEWPFFPGWQRKCRLE